MAYRLVGTQVAMATKASSRPPSRANGQPHRRARGAGRDGGTQGSRGGTAGSEGADGGGGEGVRTGEADDVAVVVSSATDAPVVVGAGVATDGVGAAGGAQVPSGGGSTLFVTVSPLVAISSTTSTFVTTWALALAAAAIVALLFIDRLKPSRPRWRAARARRRGQPLEAIAVVEEPTVLYRRTPIWKRVFSLGGLGVMAVVLGALLATVAAVVAIAALTLLGGLS